MYVKLFASILDSSVWDESAETRLVWITMLVMADENGFVRGTITSLSRRAVVSVEQAERAVRTLEAPDPRSHTTDHEGRRIEPVDGGWVVLNYGKYREYRTRKQVKEADKKRRQRERERISGGTSPACPDVSPPYASAPASGSSVVSSSVAEKLNADGVMAYRQYPANAAMDKVLEQEAAKRTWGEVSQCLVEMAAAQAQYTPHVVRSFLAKIPRPSSVNPALPGAAQSRWCQHCDGPVMRENEAGRLTPHHTEDCRRGY